MIILELLEQFLSINLFTSISGFVFGVAVLWLSAELVIKKITPIAKYFKVKELVITILGVSMLSSLPEFTVSLFANLQGSSDISIGNIVGSNFVTLTFVTSLCALILPISASIEIKERESTWMTLSSTIMFLLTIDGKLTRIDGAILIILYIPYIYSVIKEAVKDSKNNKNLEDEDKNLNNNKSILPHIFFGLIAIIGIIVGAEITLKSGEQIGHKAGIPDLALGIIIFAFGTSLPELAIALSATFKKKADITIGEIYASNIFTAMFVLGACCLIRPMDNFDKNIVNFDLPFLILAGIIIQIFITTNSRLVRLEAVIILLLYIYFVLGHFLPLSFSF